ncbi:MAG TPA: hemerythrin domain-containing protein [Holophagaceae bacterium]|nr:hemerythrin domain-containing protein [Holophagaceae bacterium]
MAATDRYRDQHRDLLRTVGVLKALLNADALARNPEPAYDMMMTLAGKLKVHLTMEDQRLYPRLLAHDQARIRDTARSFQSEMGNLMELYDAFLQRWVDPDSIRRAPDRYMGEVNEFLHRLLRRIEKEDHLLYGMVDELGTEEL